MAKQKYQIRQNKESIKKQENKQEDSQEDKQARIRFEERQPTMDRKITLSRDKKWLIIKTIRTDIVHVNYMEKILGTGETQ
jgi:hypothetical protein